MLAVLVHAFLFFCSACLCYLYLRFAQRRHWLDIPNQRSAHVLPTPRGGGLIFIMLWLLVVIGISIFQPTASHFLWMILPSVFVVAVTGYLDDRYGVAAQYRLLLYALASGFAALSLDVAFVFAFFVLLWSTNLFNFMDGMDGIAAMEAVIMLLCGTGFLLLSGGVDLALFASTLAVCVGGFLVWNSPPARLFMGDVGSASLGFIIPLLAFLGQQYYGVPFLLWVILYMSFLCDTAFTLVRRILAGERWYEAHCSHAYQRLHQMGWSHKQVLLVMSGVNLCLVALAWIAFFNQDLMMLMLFCSIMLVGTLYGVVERYSPMTHSVRR